ncbi:MAG TPA: NADH-ubiquinone oxidoreductase-F iron-sulfur binding region domain-containing protein [Actinomycetes bacterium]|nr:NADH-ubiquinone oxidoreductase-F iron-sulfur binding region domain-containing protein [Actinomycetes bacterium]
MSLTVDAPSALDTAPRLLAAPSPDLATHRATFGELPWQGRRRLVSEVEASGLLGRGGAGFPAWRKMVASAAGGDAVVIANAAEGEPASAKDATLLSVSPHLVLDGLQLAAEAVGAKEAHLYVRPGRGEHAARTALAERRGRDRVEVTVTRASGHFLDGEETAVISALEGRVALPRDKRIPAPVSGMRGRPTLLHNVETLAHVALIARGGSAWFRTAGTAEEPGTFLATVSGDVASPGVVEAGYGVPLADLFAAVGGPSADLQAVLIGGYHGAWVPLADADDAARIAVSRAGLAPYGATPGAGVVVALRSGACALAATSKVLTYLAGQSARQCGPCLNGLPALAENFAALAGGRAPRNCAQRVERLSELVERRGACHHPDGTARLARSALRAFEEDVRAHLSGRCAATGLMIVGRP